jgi:hypothetical protein
MLHCMVSEWFAHGLYQIGGCFEARSDYSPRSLISSMMHYIWGHLLYLCVPISSTTQLRACSQLYALMLLVNIIIKEHFPY